MISTINHRRYQRTSCVSDVLVLAGQGVRKRKLRGRIRDVSPCGLSLQTETDASEWAGSPVVVEWTIPPDLGLSPHPVRCRLPGRIVHTTSTACGIRLDVLIAEEVRSQNASWNKILVALAAALLCLSIVFLKSRNIVSFWYDPLFQIYSLGAATYVLSRIGFSLFYRDPKDQGFLARVTCIIAVKNEQDHIGETVRRCFQSRFPSELMEVMVVDDGSTDGTWAVLQDLARRFPQLKTYRFEKNRGKRHAMALGAEKASGEFLIYLDSDSWVEPEGIYRILQPFADPSVGAVAGHTLVIVEPDNFISKMEAARYFVSQRIMKAAESIFHSVTCCPGPFSAYRRQAVLDILPAWQHQRFMGTEATFGDDRSLTNFILRKYCVLYHAGARCATYVPNRWKVFFRQQLRWKKSWARETTVAARFMFRRPPMAALSYYLGVVITLVSPLIALRALFYMPAIHGSATFLPYLGGLFMVYGLLCLIYRYFTKASHWYYGIGFAFVYAFILCFQNYYAILTVRRNHWGTR